MDENNEIEAICYQPNLTEKQLCTSVFYKKALNYVSDTGLNIFHIQAQAGNMLLIKFLLTNTCFKEPEYYAKDAYKKRNILFLILENLEITKDQQDMFKYLIEHTELGKSLINKKNNNDYNILTSCIYYSHEKDIYYNLAIYLLKNTELGSKYLETLVGDGYSDKKCNVFEFCLIHSKKELIKYFLENSEYNIDKHLPQLLKQSEKYISSVCPNIEQIEIHELLNSYQEKQTLEKLITKENISTNRYKV